MQSLVSVLWAPHVLYRVFRGAFADEMVLGLLVGFFACFLLLAARRLKPHTFVFDRARNTLTFNGDLVCGLSRLKSVHVEKSYVRAGAGGSSSIDFFLRLDNDALVPIDQNQGGLLGPGIAEMTQVSQAIALYADIPMIAPDL